MAFDSQCSMNASAVAQKHPPVNLSDPSVSSCFIDSFFSRNVYVCACVSLGTINLLHEMRASLCLVLEAITRHEHERKQNGKTNQTEPNMLMWRSLLQNMKRCLCTFPLCDCCIHERVFLFFASSYIVSRVECVCNVYCVSRGEVSFVRWQFIETWCNDVHVPCFGTTSYCKHCFHWTIWKSLTFGITDMKGSRRRKNRVELVPEVHIVMQMICG